MFNKILVPYDGSMASEQAYALAVKLAEKCDSAILVLVIARPPEPTTSFQTNPYLDEVREHYKERFATLGRHAGTKLVKVRFDIRVGRPAEEIVHAAERESVELVVIGRRGRNGVQCRRLGSVSERVIG